MDGALANVLQSLALYTRNLFKQWWATVGLLFGALGIVLKLTGWAQPPTAFWVAVALLTVLIASFQLFHSDRMAAIERIIAIDGPALPYWDGIGLRGNRGGETYLEVMACGQDKNRPSISTADFPSLRRELIAALGLQDQGLQTRSFNNFFEVTLPADQGGFSRLAKVDTSNAQLFIKLSWRLDAAPVDLRTMLVRGVDGIRTLRSGACARLLGKRPWFLISLADWPKAGIALGDLVTASSWAEADHRGQSVYVQARLDRRASEWDFVVGFVVKVLGDAGFIGFESSMQRLTEAAVRSHAVQASPGEGSPTAQEQPGAPT